MSNQIATCIRCSKLGQTGSQDNALCADCAATSFLKSIDVFMLSIELRGPEILLAPHVQAQFSQLMAAGQAGTTPEEIDWQRVVDNWDLPLPKKRKEKRSTTHG